MPKLHVNFVPFDLSQLGTNSQIALDVIVDGNMDVIISGVLGDARGYKAGEHSATLDITNNSTGNVAGTVTFSWNATTLTIKGSAHSNVLGEEAMLAGYSGGYPTNYAISDQYEVDILLGSFAYTNQYVFVTGMDRETEDTNAVAPLETGSIKGAADFMPPLLTVKSPSGNLKTYNPVVEFEGSFREGELGTNSVFDVYDVTLQVDGGGYTNIDQSDELPTNSLSWTATVDLSQLGHPGSNQILVLAEDELDNTTVVTRTVFWIQTNAVDLSISPSAAGTVKGLNNGANVLDVGGSYPVTATASPGYIFSDWTDGSGKILSTSASFSFVDTNSQLTANFAANPFYQTGLAGTYSGLFSVPGAIAPSNSGYITLTVTPSASYSGRFTWAAWLYPLAFPASYR